MSDDTTTVSGAIPDVVITEADDQAAAAAVAEAPAPAPPADDPEPERVTTLLRLVCGHVFGTDAPCATHHYCDTHDAVFPVVSAHEAPSEG